MSDPRRHRVILLFVLLLLSVGTVADNLTGTVVRVLDGDTVEVLAADTTLHRVRLGGIDAPETGQPFGTKAKQHLPAPVGGRTVVIARHKRDRCGRLVGKIVVGGADANLSMVDAENAARRDGVGLRIDPRPIAPRGLAGRQEGGLDHQVERRRLSV